MRTETFDVKSKGQVVAQATVELPESIEEAKSNEAANLAAMWYGLRVKAANAARQQACGGPRSIPRLLAAKMKDSPELKEKVRKLLGLSEEEFAAL